MHENLFEITGIQLDRIVLSLAIIWQNSQLVQKEFYLHKYVQISKNAASDQNVNLFPRERVA